MANPGAVTGAGHRQVFSSKVRTVFVASGVLVRTSRPAHGIPRTLKSAEPQARPDRFQV